MRQTSTRSEDWNDAISDASQHVADREQAGEEAAARQRPKSSAPRLIVTFVALVAVAAWNVQAYTAAPDPVPTQRARTGAAWLMADDIQAISDFAEEQGRLPDALEVNDLIDASVVYRPSDAGFTLASARQELGLVYDSQVPLEAWLEAQVATDQTGAAP